MRTVFSNLNGSALRKLGACVVMGCLSVFVACTKKETKQTPSESTLSGLVQIDGSSTVYPISAAIAEEFQQEVPYRKVRVTVAYSGTGGGFKKWCKGETDINNASRQIKQKEIDCAKKSNIRYLELPVAYDGISVVVSQSNTFAKSLTMKQLNELWKPGSKIKTWKQLNAAWPNEPIKLYGPGHDSGTFDYFTEAVNHKSRSSRTENVTVSEDDNVLVKGVAASKNAMGYFGYAYYVENKSKLRALALDKGEGAIGPNKDTIENNSYPLARPVFIYVSSTSAARPEVQAFVRYYLKSARQIVESVRYTPLTESEYEQALAKFENFVQESKKLAKVTPNNG